MEGISSNVYKGLKKYWKRKGYQRLKNNNNNGEAEAVQTGYGQDPNPVPRRRRRSFRVKITRRMRILTKVVGLPKKWLTRLRDAYVNMMLNLANTGLAVGSGVTGFGGSVGYGYGLEHNMGQVKEYDEKMIVEIYKSLVIAQGKIGGDAKANNSQQGPVKVSISARHDKDLPLCT